MPRQCRRHAQYQHLWLTSRTPPVHLSSPFSSNRSSARHHLLHHINRRVIQRLLLGLWRRSRYNPSPHNSRQVITAFLQRLSRPVSRMDRRSRTTPEMDWSDSTPLFNPPPAKNTTLDFGHNQDQRQCRICASPKRAQRTETSHRRFRYKGSTQVEKWQRRCDDDCSFSNVLPSGATHAYHRSSLDISLSTIVSTRYSAYIAMSRSSTQVRSRRL